MMWLELTVEKFKELQHQAMVQSSREALTEMAAALGRKYNVQRLRHGRSASSLLPSTLLRRDCHN